MYLWPAYTLLHRTDEAEADRDMKAHMFEEAKKAFKRGMGAYDIALKERDAATEKAKELRAREKSNHLNPKPKFDDNQELQAPAASTRRSESSTPPAPEAEEEEEGEGKGGA